VKTEWHYSREEWEAFLKREADTLDRTELVPVVWMVFGIALAFGIATYLGKWDPDLNALAGCLVVVSAALWFGFKFRPMRQLARGTPAVEIREDGIRRAGKFFSWRGGDEWMLVEVEDGTPMVLRFEWPGESAEGSNWVVRVPVPSGREDEARAIAARMHRPRR
jgi:hypothetical protein